MMRPVVLLQVNSFWELDKNIPALRRLLLLPGVDAISLRVPGRTLNPSPGVVDMSTFDRIDALAAEIEELKGGPIEVQVRSMGGRWAPDHIIDDPRNNLLIWPGTVLSQDVRLPIGTEIPMCFNRDGGVNTFWYQWCYRMFRRLCRWGRLHPRVKVMHGFWSGLTWAEPACVKEMEAVLGFNYGTIEAFHELMMRDLVDMWRGDVEFALSGHFEGYPLGGKLSTVANQLNVIINRNDIGGPHQQQFPGDLENSLRSIKYPPRHGWQMWGTGADYPWSTIYSIGNETVNGHIRAEYIEHYPGNFGPTPESSQLATVIRNRLNADE